MSTFFRDGTDDGCRARRVWILASFCVLLIPVFAHAQPRPDSSFVDPDLPARVERARDYDLLHTALDLRVAWDRKAVSGSATHRLTPLVPELDVVRFDQHGLTFFGAAHADGRALDWTVQGDTVAIRLERAYHPDEVLTLRLDYEAVDPVAGMFFKIPDADRPERFQNLWTQGQAEENRYWFPGYDSPNELATTEQRITVERRFTVAANGVLVDRRQNPDGTDTWQFRLDVPHAPYLTALVVGEYQILEDERRGVPILSYVRPSRASMAPRSFDRTGDMLALYEDLTGVPYPYPVYRQAEVEEYLFGGMENATLSVLSSTTLHDAVAGQIYDSLGLVAHEIAHQWFGDYVTTRTWDHTWLNEGFATYCEILFSEFSGDRDRAAWELYDYQRDYLASDEETRRPMVTAWYGHPDDMFDSVGYSKGAAVVHMLRHRLGEDHFREVLRRYLTDYGPGTVVTDDLQRVAEVVSGVSFARFFDQWAHHGGHPEFVVDWEWDSRRSEGVVRVRQTQEVDELTPYFRVPVSLDFTGAGWTERRDVWAQGPEQEFRFKLPGRPLMVEFDADNHIVKTLQSNKSTAEWRYQLEHSRSMISRARAAEELGDHPGGPTLAALIRCLQDRREYWSVREEAAWSLARLGGSKAWSALLEGASSSDARIRRASVEALGRLGDSTVHPRLLQLVRSDPSPQVAAAAVEAAGEIGGDAALVTLRAGLARPSWRDMVKAEALDALGQLESDDAWSMILPYTAPQASMPLRGGALRSLSRVASSLEVTDPRRPVAVARLRNALESDTVQIRLAAISGLRRMGEDARKTLREVVSRDDHPMVLRSARSALRSLDRD